ncbi:MAG: hypothetical protein D6693_04805 [Planctomycetota bacterium]|nr:MAG: hypothetical protein D6693_04805 [Planctomycetota bacterium]
MAAVNRRIRSRPGLRAPMLATSLGAVLGAHAAAQVGPSYTLETERVTAVMASATGVDRLVVSGAFGFYRTVTGQRGAPSRLVREYCDSLPPGEVYRHPECVLLREHEFLSSGRIDEFRALFMPGPWRERAVAEMTVQATGPGRVEHQSADELHAAFEAFTGASPIEAFFFGDTWHLAYVRHAGDGFTIPQPGERWPSPDAAPYVVSREVQRYDAASDRFWITSNDGSAAGMPRLVETAMTAVGAGRSGRLQDFDRAAMAIREFPVRRLEGPPAGLSAWRVEPASPPEDADQSRVRLVPIADPSAPGAIGEHDLVLYVNPTPLPDVPPSATTPFLQIDDVLLDHKARTLKSELARALAVSDGGAPFDERYLDTVHPAAHDRLRQSEQRRRANQAQSGGIIEAATPLSFPAHAMPSLRVVSRVDTGECVVWFGWLPDAMTVLRRRTGAAAPPIAEDTPGQFVTVVQRKAGGDLRLTFNDTPGLLGPERLAVKILCSPGVAESMVRARLPIMP